MCCARCGKEKPANGYPQCAACVHVRTGAKWFAMKRRVVIASNVKKSLANRLARIGMTRLVNQFLAGG